MRKIEKSKIFNLSDKEIRILLLGLGHIPMHIRFLNMNYKETDEAIEKLANKLIS